MKPTESSIPYYSPSSSETQSSQAWAVSYSDMITQLLVFFLILLASSRINTAKFDAIQKSLRGEKNVEQPLERIQHDLQEALSKHHLADFVAVEKDQDGIVMLIKDSLLFSSGEDHLKDSSEAKLEPIFAVLRDLPSIYRFAIEGHTDDVPIHNQQFNSNWHLSAARGLAVISFFQKSGIAESRLSVVAFGEHKPLVPNRTESGEAVEQNRHLNRRVAIRVK